MWVAFFSTKSTKLLRPPSGFVAALLVFRPPTLSVVLLTTGLGPLGPRGTCEVSPPRWRSRFCWSRALDLGPVDLGFPRRDEVLMGWLGPAPDLVREAAPISRSPSRSVRVAGRLRFETPPRVVPREAPEEPRVPRAPEEAPARVPARGPVGGAITTMVERLGGSEGGFAPSWARGGRRRGAQLRLAGSVASNAVRRMTVAFVSNEGRPEQRKKSVG